ncbi:hypothetical protein Tsedi_01676 [Tepidimonas sediminis]|uniref:Uncharacterized protein n=1 Tax=Tepidimonas sediminis TaxID=2588941 RepID=A0A554WNF1_9BURK|nr:hypothetical protein Tsedi_01676 [Tepidimonas sediminis]
MDDGAQATQEAAPAPQQDTPPQRVRIDQEGRRSRNRRRRGKGKGAGPAQGGPGQATAPTRPNPPQGGRKPAAPPPARQPDPLRTGIDALSGRRDKNKNRPKGGGGIDPLRTSFGRIR